LSSLLNRKPPLDTKLKPPFFLTGYLSLNRRGCQSSESWLKFAVSAGTSCHATAIESDEHLHRCLVYTGLHMVRAGVVEHNAE